MEASALIPPPLSTPSPLPPKYKQIKVNDLK